MLTSLKATNFRQFANVELDFRADNPQLIFISGANGSGKTSLIEMIGYALYGETRYGRTGLDDLVKSGKDAEIEGMEVELEFQAAGEDYRVVRKRRDSTTGAWLWAGSHLLADTPRGVDTEMEELLGVDTVGFRLAVLAHQHEIEGLAAHSKATRIQTVSRLLRMDLVEKAKKLARDELNQSRNIMNSVNPPDLEPLQQQLTETETRNRSLAETEKSAKQKLGRLESLLRAARYGGGDRYELAVRVDAALRTKLGAYRTELEKAAGDLADIPEAAGSVTYRTLEAARLAAADAEGVWERLTAEAAAASDRQQELRQWETDQARLEEIEHELRGLPTGQQVEVLRSRLTDQETELAGLVTSYDETKQLLAQQRATVSRNSSRLERLEKHRGVCVTCGQSLPEHLRRKSVHQARDEQDRLDICVTETRQKLMVEEAAVSDAQRRQADLSRELHVAVTRHETRTRLRQKAAEIRATLPAVPPTGQVAPDPEVLEQARTRYRTARETLTNLSALGEKMRDRVGLERRAGELERQVTIWQRRVNSFAPRLAVRVEEKTRYDRLNAEVVAAKEVWNEAHKTLLSSDAELRECARAVTEAEELWETKRELQNRGMVASYVSDLFDLLRDSVMEEARPRLETFVSQRLETMAPDRFGEVKFSESYEVEIQDRGVWRPLTQLSGGEAGLVALATRLGLAALLTDSGLGCLILDECLTAQDPDRCDSILNGLRALKPVYGQIFLVSHIPGLAEHCDRIINVDYDGVCATVKDL